MIPYPPHIVLPIESGLEKMMTEEPFKSHPEFAISVRKYYECGYRHSQLGWIKVLFSDTIRSKLEWTFLDMELKANSR